MARTVTVVTPELEQYQSRFTQNLSWVIDAEGHRDAEGRTKPAAKRIGIDPSALERILDGLNFPGFPTQVAIGRTYDINPGEFLLPHADFKRKATTGDGLLPFGVAQATARERLRATASEQSQEPAAAGATGTRDDSRLASRLSEVMVSVETPQVAKGSQPKRGRKGTIGATGALLNFPVRPAPMQLRNRQADPKIPQTAAA